MADFQRRPGRTPVAGKKQKQVAGDRAVSGTVVASNPREYGKTGMDLTGPGYGEEAYGRYGSEYFKPGKAEKYNERTGAAYEREGVGETTGKEMSKDFSAGAQGDSAGQQYWEGVRGRMQDGGPGYSKNAYDQFEQNVGGPGLDAYYDQAFKRTQQRLDRSAASRGMYGSSYAMQGVSDAAVALGAEQANREADYRLRRQAALENSARNASDDELSWTKGMGDLAFGAGKESLEYGLAAVDAGATAQELEQDRLKNGYAAAMGIDEFSLASRNSGIEAAGLAQHLREGRIQGMFDNQLKIGDRYTGFYENANNQDTLAAQQQAAAALGMSLEEYQRSQASTNAAYNEWLAGMETFAGAANPVGSMGGGASNPKDKK